MLKFNVNLYNRNRKLKIRRIYKLWIRTNTIISRISFRTDITTINFSLNNSLRQQVDGALAAVRLLSTDRGERLTAARALLADMGEGAALLPLFDKALAREQDGEIKPILVQLAAQAALGSPDVARRLQAVAAAWSAVNVN